MFETIIGKMIGSAEKLLYGSVVARTRKVVRRFYSFCPRLKSRGICRLYDEEEIKRRVHFFLSLIERESWKKEKEKPHCCNLDFLYDSCCQNSMYFEYSNL